jgi:transcriptional regulator with XRE-family HTH domain
VFWDNYLRLCNSVDKAPNAVAAEIGIKSSGTVTGWRKGSLPRQSVLIKIADYFGVDVSDLLAGHSVKVEEPDDATLEEALADLHGKNEPEQNSFNDAMKFALFGTADVTDETYAEVKRFAKFALEQQKRNRNES